MQIYLSSIFIIKSSNQFPPKNDSFAYSTRNLSYIESKYFLHCPNFLLHLLIKYENNVENLTSQKLNLNSYQAND